jgi:hypothetical protein
MLMLNRNARNSMRHFDVNFYSSVNLFSVCIVLATLRCLCINDNISSTISIRCSVISINIINFYLIKVAYFLMLFVDNSRSKVSCTLKVTKQEFIKSICSRNSNLLICYSSELICLNNEKLSTSKRL